MRNPVHAIVVALLSIVAVLPCTAQSVPEQLEFELSIDETSYAVMVKAGEGSQLTGHLDVPSTYRFRPVTVIWNLSSDITSVSIPASITRIEDNGFAASTKLKSIVIPNTVKYVGVNAFRGCTSLSSVVVSPNNSLTTAFPGCDIVKGAYPEGKRSFVADIEVPYPTDCVPRADGLIFNKGMTTFYFAPYDIDEVELPASITTVGPKAFAGCQSIKTLIVRATTPPTAADDAFDNAGIKAIIVPYGTKEIYRQAPGWKSFASVIRESGIGIGCDYVSFNLPVSDVAVELPISVSCADDPSYVDFVSAKTSDETIAKASVSNVNGSPVISVNPLTNGSTVLTVSCRGVSREMEIKVYDFIKTVKRSIQGVEESLDYPIPVYVGRTTDVLLNVGLDRDIVGDMSISDMTACDEDKKPVSNFITCGERKVYGRTYTGIEGLSSGWGFLRCSVAPPTSDGWWPSQMFVYFSVFVEVGTQGGFDFTINGDWKGYAVSANSSAVLSGDVIIPSMFNSKPVTAVGNSAFINCTKIDRIEIPSTVTELRPYAFSGCTGLTSIDIPNSVTSIGKFVFQYNKLLKGCVIPPSVKSMDSSNFLPELPYYDDDPYGSYPQTKVAIPSNLKASIDQFSIDRYSIYPVNNAYFAEDGCIYNGNRTELYYVPVDIDNVEIKSGVTKIGAHAFSFCDNLTEIGLPQSLTEIGDGAFRMCSNLKSISLPRAVKIIPNNCFSGCVSLEDVDFGYVAEIRNMSFFNCSSLRGVMIPPVTQSIASNSFARCPGLVKSACPSHIKNGNSTKSPINTGYVYQYPASESVIVDDMIFSRDMSVLYYMPYTVVDVDIPVTVRRIEKSAPYKCENLSHIVIPASVTEIEDAAFETNNRLRSIVCAPENPVIFDSRYEAFPNEVYESATLIVPPASEEAYRGANSWKNFMDISTPEPVSSQFALGYAAISMFCGEKVALLGANQEALAPYVNFIYWNTDNADVGNIHPSGSFHALSEGVSDIHAALFGVNDTCRVNIAPSKADHKCVLSGIALVTDSYEAVAGIPFNVDYDVILEEDEALDCYDLEWESSNPYVAEVSEDGVVTPLAKGQTTVSLTLKHGERVNGYLYGENGGDKLTLSARVNVDDKITGIGDVSSSDKDCLPVVYSLQGVLVGKSIDGLNPGIYIVKRNDRVEKVFVK